uniref:RRM domain-containing protein n=1 Tax=Eptatretus burgeri TaxID=7764 RepID=A0A8C4R2R9_EPTBU
MEDHVNGGQKEAVETMEMGGVKTDPEPEAEPGAEVERGAEAEAEAEPEPEAGVEPEPEAEAEPDAEAEAEPDHDAEVESDATPHTDNFQFLLNYGLSRNVAESLDNIYMAGTICHGDLDERALEALKEFSEAGALSVLHQFKDSDLSHVQVLLDRTGYTLDVTTGQRKYGGPPPSSVYPGTQACEIIARSFGDYMIPPGHAVFVGKIPRDMYEDELVPLFEKTGEIFDLRLMMDPLTGLNRGYAFLTYCKRAAAQECVRQLDNHEIRSGRHLGICLSVANNRLFIGSIPKKKSRKEVQEEFSKIIEGLTEVILYQQVDDPRKNRGFCFLEFEEHKYAAQARRKLLGGKTRVFGHVVTVEWADPVDSPDPEIMARVKVLFVRKLANTVTEPQLETLFSQYGKLERVKKVKDFAFIHFDLRTAALKAMVELNGTDLDGETLEIVLAKPPDRKRKERQRNDMRGPGDYDDNWYGHPSPRLSRGHGGQGDFSCTEEWYGYEEPYDDYGYDYYDYRGGYDDPYYSNYEESWNQMPRVRSGRGGHRGLSSVPMSSYGPIPGGRSGGGYSAMHSSYGASHRGGSRSGTGGYGPRRGGGMARGGGGVGGKRKFEGIVQPETKRRQVGGQLPWASQPIAQQPLGESIHWDHTLCRVLVLPKQTPWILDTILDGSPLRHRIPASWYSFLPTSEG